jgi:Tol biopolymer transport system component
MPVWSADGRWLAFDERASRISINCSKPPRALTSVVNEGSQSL